MDSNCCGTQMRSTTNVRIAEIDKTRVCGSLEARFLAARSSAIRSVGRTTLNAGYKVAIQAVRHATESSRSRSASDRSFEAIQLASMRDNFISPEIISVVPMPNNPSSQNGV